VSPESPVSILPIGRSKKELGRFFDVADHVYRGDPNWVAPLRDDVAKVFSPKNPFWEHAEIQLFVARRGGEDVGRIARDALTGLPPLPPFAQLFDRALGAVQAALGCASSGYTYAGLASSSKTNRVLTRYLPR